MPTARGLGAFSFLHKHLPTNGQRLAVIGTRKNQVSRYETENDIVVETDALNSGSDLLSTHEPCFGAS